MEMIRYLLFRCGIEHFKTKGIRKVVTEMRVKCDVTSRIVSSMFINFCDFIYP